MIADSASANTAAITPVVGGGELLGMGISMAIVVAAILLLGWMYSRSRLAGSGSSDVINIVASRALGPKERLMVVDVADQQLLIGMTSTAVQTLHVFDKPVEIPAQPVIDGGFSGRLKAAVREMRK